ncbi:hypothetical protein [Nocardiopsis potens]|uniref:hypothetical protein n=1 Tax=Nocardiopsis potens TaxID=1246458 RepID=UPI001267E305|nr:hypothetical protein [Nocardiopsis potens]
MDTRTLDGVLHVRDRVAAVLVELDRGVAHRLLQGAELTGATRERWERGRAELALLWRLFDAYGHAASRAEAARGDPAALAALLGGDSVELVRPEAAAGEAGLLGAEPERYTFDAAVRRMSAAYDTGAAAVAAIDAAWAELLPRVERLEAALAEADAAAGRTGPAPGRDALAAGIAEAAAAVRTDPLGVGAGTARLDRLDADAARLLEAVRAAERARTGFPARRAGLAVEVAEADAAAEAARRSRDRTGARIAGPAPAAPPDTAALHGRLADLDRLHRDRRWTELAAAADAVQRDARAVADAARRCERADAELLARRAELRGRLDAYRTKAVRLGLAEDPGAARLLRTAHGLLWSAPCDLAAAEAALADYRRAVADAARRCERADAELLARRAELRGRLDAYRTKAVRLGLAEDPGAARLLRTAHGLLWSAPCDLAAAEAALADYRRAVAAASERPAAPAARGTRGRGGTPR